MSKNIQNGIIFALLTAAISGISIFYNKLVVVGGIDALVFNIMKNGGVAVVLTLGLVGGRMFPRLTRLSPKNWFLLFLIGIVGGSIPFVLFFEGLQTVSPATANLIHKTLFLWVAVLAIPILGERLSAGQVIGYGVVALSTIVLNGLDGLSLGRGEQLILLATLLWSVENIIAKIAVKDIDSTIVAWGRMAIGSIVLVFIAVLQGKLVFLARVTPEQWFATAGSVVFLSGYVLTWYRALSYAPATLVASILILATPVTNVLSALFITGVFPQPQMGNLIGTVAGLVLVTIFVQLPVRKSTIRSS